MDENLGPDRKDAEGDSTTGAGGGADPGRHDLAGESEPPEPVAAGGEGGASAASTEPLPAAPVGTPTSAIDAEPEPPDFPAPGDTGASGSTAPGDTGTFGAVAQPGAGGWAPGGGGTAGTGQQPGPGAWAPAGVRRLTRSSDDRVLAGVAGGLGRWLGVDPRAVRIAFVVLTVFGGAGLLLYGIAWLAIPDEHATEAPAENLLRKLRHAPTWVQVLLIVVLFIIFASNGGFDGPNIVLALVLIGLGFVLFRQDTRAAFPSGPPPGPGPGPGQGPAPWTPPPSGSGSTWSAQAPAPVQPMATDTQPLAPAPGAGLYEPPAGGAPPAGGWQAPPQAGWGPPPPPRPPRPRSMLGRITVAAVLLASGAAALLDRLGAFDMSGQRYVALALTVLGVGLVAGAWWGRARWLLGAGMILVPLLILGSAVRVPMEGGVGDRHYVPGSLAEVHSEYRLAMGDMTLDLSEVDFGPQATRVAAGVGVGELTVIVPSDVTVRVDGTIRAGDVDLFGQRLGGTDRHPDHGAPPTYDTVSPGKPDGGQLQLDIDSGLGEVTVRRALAG
jgi:phage shock protein PspC (stress-responsive transcriptional regulator)